MNRQLGLFFMIGALLWMALIFGFSGDDGRVSSKQSNNLLVALKVIDQEKLQKQYYNPEVKKMRILIRKFAHIGLYTALGALVFVGLIFAFPGRSKQRVILLTILLTGLYAITDEIHQYFVPGRAARVEDVFIDLSGVAFGIATCLLLSVSVVQAKRIWCYLTTEEDTEKASSEVRSIELA